MSKYTGACATFRVIESDEGVWNNVIFYEIHNNYHAFVSQKDKAFTKI